MKYEYNNIVLARISRIVDLMLQVSVFYIAFWMDRNVNIF